MVLPPPNQSATDTVNIPPPPPSTLPQMCYRVGATGYLSNGNEASCPFTACKMQELCATTNFENLVARQNHGANQDGAASSRCYLTQRKILARMLPCERHGIFSNGSQSCAFTAGRMQKYCGKDVSHFNELPAYCDEGGNEMGPPCQG